VKPQRNAGIVNPRTADTVGRRILLCDISHPLVESVLRIWTQQRIGKLFPSRELMVSRRMAPFLKDVVLIGVVNQGADFEFRVVGRAIRVAFSRNVSGMRIADLNRLENGFGDVIQQVCRHVFRTGIPLAVQGTLIRADLDAHHQQSVFLPLGVGADVDHILYVVGYSQEQ